jgi:hypothetical protein
MWMLALTSVGPMVKRTGVMNVLPATTRIWHRRKTAHRRLGLVLVAAILVAIPTQWAGQARAQSVTATATYDDAGRLRTTTYSDGKSVGYALDAAGNRTSTAEGALPQLSVGAASVTEGGNLVFTVTRTGTPTATFTVDCAQTGGTATPGSDYTASTQPLTFLVTDTSKTCSVTTLQDSIYEGPHTLGALLQNPGGPVLIATSSALGTINDNDTPPAFSVSGGSAVEGASITFTITKTGTTDLEHAITYATANGTATTADSDYTSVASTTTFALGQTSVSVVVPTTTDGKYELNETLVLNLSNATNGATISGSQASGTITNNDAAPSFAINSPAVMNEGSAITFTVTKGGNTSTGVSHGFNWATANNTAVAPGDYTAASGSITFAPADTQKTFLVQTVTDGVLDSTSNETFFANLTTNAGTNGATISTSQGTGTIADLQSLPSVPTNVRKSPATGTSPNYSIMWDASTGTVNHYTLEEEQINPSTGTLTYTSTTLSKGFNKGQVFLELLYRVRACASANESQCSPYSGTIFKMVCPTSGCP